LLSKYQNIREVEKFLEETKAKYLDVTQHLSSETETQVTSSTFNENQRAEIEREVMLWISQLTRLQQQLTTTLGFIISPLSSFFDTFLSPTYNHKKSASIFWLRV